MNESLVVPELRILEFIKLQISSTPKSLDATIATPPTPSFSTRRRTLRLSTYGAENADANKIRLESIKSSLRRWKV